MDWFSWLSKTSLEPSLIYEYGLAFTRNELQEEDITYFNHELLQSMGISVAKYRLEILKVARKEIGGSPHTLSRLLSAIRRTKRSLTKGIGRWVSHEDADSVALPEPRPYQARWSGALSKKHMRSMELKQERLTFTNRTLKISEPSHGREQRSSMLTTRRPKVSGPLDGRLQEGLLLTNRSPKASGPLDGPVQERSVLINRSPRVSGRLNCSVSSPRQYRPYNEETPDSNDGIDSIWAALFQDMKPT